MLWWICDCRNSSFMGMLEVKKVESFNLSICSLRLYVGSHSLRKYWVVEKILSFFFTLHCFARERPALLSTSWQMSWTPWNHKKSFFFLDDPLSIIMRDHSTRESAPLMTICQTFIDSQMTCTDYQWWCFFSSQEPFWISPRWPPASCYLLDSHCKQ